MAQKELLLYTLRYNLEVTGIIDQFESLIWNSCYESAGNFELVVRATPKNLEILQTHQYIARSDLDRGDGEVEIMYIESIQDKHDDEKKTVIVSGYSAEGIFRKRTFPYWLKPSELIKMRTLADVLQKITSFGCDIVYEGSMERPLDSIDISDMPDNYLKGDMESYIRYAITKETVTKASDSDSDIGEFTLPSTYVLRLDLNSYPKPRLIFRLVTIRPVDTVKPAMLYTEDFDNLTDHLYSYSEADCYSCIHAEINPNFSVSVIEETHEYDEHGEEIVNSYSVGPGDIVSYGSWPTFDLNISNPLNPLTASEKLIFVDPIIEISDKKETEQVPKYVRPDENLGSAVIASAGQLEYDVVTSEVKYFVINEEKTLDAMKKACEEVALIATENVQGTLKAAEDYRDLFVVGDILIIRDNYRLRDIYKRVNYVEESFDNSGYKVTLTLGDPLKTLYDLIKENSK